MVKRTQPLILHVGGEDVRMRIPILKHLVNRGFEVGAVGSEEAEPFEREGIRYFRYPLERWINPIADLRSLSVLERIFREIQPDLVHGFDTKPALLAPIAAKRAGVRGRIRTINGMGYVFSSDSLLARILRPVYHLLQHKASACSDTTIFQNRDDQKYFLENDLVPNDCSALVQGSGIDLTRFRKNRVLPERIRELRKEIGVDENLMILMVTRITRTKGVYELLSAAKIIQRQYPKAQIVLVGPAASEGKEAVDQSILECASPYVRYLGVRDDIPELLAAADLFVLPSFYREGVPRVLLEAGVMGVPLITTDMPGCKEVIVNENGWLVPPRNEEALAKAMLYALSLGRDTLKTIGEKGVAEITEKFSLINVVSAHVEIYSHALKKSSLGL